MYYRRYGTHMRHGWSQEPLSVLEVSRGWQRFGRTQ